MSGSEGLVTEVFFDEQASFWVALVSFLLLSVLASLWGWSPPRKAHT